MTRKAKSFRSVNDIIQMLPGNNVIDVKVEQADFLRKQTIFTTIPSSLTNQLA